MPEQLITPKDAAILLSCTIRSLQKLYKRKDFPSIKVKGLGRRIYRDRLLAWLQTPSAHILAKSPKKKEKSPTKKESKTFLDTTNCSINDPTK